MASAPRPSFADDLDGTLEEAFRLLARGKADRRSPFHTPCIATLGPDGRPRLRTMVLRAVDPSRRTLRFHTDARSDKAAELSADDRAAVHFYDPGAKIQIRLEGRAILHGHDALADEAWAQSRPMSRACYGVMPGPGERLDAAGGFSLPADEAASAAGREHFRVVLFVFERLEWLWLEHAGHRRALFLWEDGLPRPESRWLVP